MDSVLIIGDIHGCLEELDELIRSVGSMNVVSVGDLIDRGPDSLGVIRRFRENSWVSVLGNHEEKALRWLRHEAACKDAGRKNPMRTPYEKRRKEWESLTQDDISWLNHAPTQFLLMEGWRVVHAGFEPGLSFEDQKTDRIIRIRYIDSITKMMVPYKDGKREQPPGTVYWTEGWIHPDNIIYGHNVHSFGAPRESQIIGGKCFGIDTGCVFGGRLTGMLLHNNGQYEYIQVPAKETYFDYSKRAYSEVSKKDMNE
ncbi:MAG TPA: metallophosphoesterase [Methylobacter sp.]|jgi:hypothetical protein